MLDKNIIKEINIFESDKAVLEMQLNTMITNIKQATKRLQGSCDHKNENDEYTIVYTHGVAFGQDMHCIQCGKIGSRKELRGGL